MQFPQGIAIAYTSIPVIGSLNEPLKRQVREAFAQSIGVIWKVNVGIAGLGFLSSLAIKGLRLHTDVDEKWGLEGVEAPQAVELKAYDSRLPVLDQRSSPSNI